MFIRSGGAVVGRTGRDIHVVTQTFEAFDQITLQALRFQPIEIVGSQIGVLHFVFQYVKDDHQQRVADGDLGSLPSRKCGEIDVGALALESEPVDPRL